MEKIRTAALLRFLIPSAAGLLIFLVPLPLDDGLTVLFSLYSDWVNVHLGFMLIEAMVVIALTGALLALYHSIAKPNWQQKLTVSERRACRVLGQPRST